MSRVVINDFMRFSRFQERIGGQVVDRDADAEADQEAICSPPLNKGKVRNPHDINIKDEHGEIVTGYNEHERHHAFRTPRSYKRNELLQLLQFR
ncbi:hypothetical protein NPIL_645531 [Nephila pilipes]|uniref:Uncharacterized protein n=1 Tax=Nephila pilipes TaxID=299642 RepID=A0A8X6TPU2_NEPPI|nr:hypothetical protein NPIL_645531 [Nephila pilipes]